jgi:hypothetical protein
MKTGPKHKVFGLQNGIHRHNRSEIRIEYFPASVYSDTVLWVKVTNKKTGEVQTYINPENPPADSLIAPEKIRLMDCIDCHNRPAHDLLAPQKFFDNFFIEGVIPVDLPDIKSVAMDILYNNTFPDNDSAMRFIESSVKEYYEIMFPEIVKNRSKTLDRAIRAIQTGYRRNIFPEMKASWKTYPNNIGHLLSNGCHRCHNDKLQNNRGETITRNCNLCHDIIEQGSPDNLKVAKYDTSLTFIHPVSIKESWKEKPCAECHRKLY